jgi:hypothetical protein
MTISGFLKVGEEVVATTWRKLSSQSSPEPMVIGTLTALLKAIEYTIFT